MSTRLAGAASRAGTKSRPGHAVSTSSAARFSARVRARRRHRMLVVVVVVALMLGAVGVGLYSPWATVQRITVSGTSRILPSTVRALLADQQGRSLLLVDTDALRTRLRTLTLVARGSVQRRWPSTLAVVIRERQAVAAVPNGAGVSLIDVEGVQVATASRDSAGLPLVKVDLSRSKPGSLPAVLAVLAGMPGSLSRQVTVIGAATPDGVWLTLADGSLVIWGSAGGTPHKAVVLTRLRAASPPMTRGKVYRYDISAPDVPAVSNVAATTPIPTPTAT